MRILGIDPGLRITGFGVIDWRDKSAHYVASGCVKTGEGELPQRVRAAGVGYDPEMRLGSLRRRVRH